MTTEVNGRNGWRNWVIGLLTSALVILLSAMARNFDGRLDKKADQETVQAMEQRINDRFNRQDASLQRIENILLHPDPPPRVFPP